MKQLKLMVLTLTLLMGTMFTFMYGFRRKRSSAVGRCGESE